MSGMDDLTIVVNGQRLSGWEEIEVTLRVEAFPNSFAVSASVSSAAAAIAAGSYCTVLLGEDLVITGYIDRVIEGGSATSHTLQLIGRGLTQDLVDCSGEWPTGQKSGVDALTIARTLALPYDGLSVELANGAAAGPAVPQWLLNFGEPGAAIIQRVARNAGLLAYEDARGVLLLARVGTERAASGIVYGGNVQAWSVETGMDGRFSEIVCCRLATDALQDLGGDDFFDRAADPNVPRHRRLYQVLEATGSDDPYVFTSLKAMWDVARRAGRSRVVSATVDSWRDSGGTLWRPNTLVPVDLPGSRGAELILGEVTFRRSSEAGTTADLVLMSKEAFVPEPIALQPVSLADLQQSGTP